VNIQQVFISVFSLVLLLAIGHWLPWSALFGRKLPRLMAYIYGSASVLVAYTIFVWPAYHLALELLTLFVVGFLTVAGCYGVDWLAKNNSQKRREVLRAKIIE